VVPNVLQFNLDKSVPLNLVAADFACEKAGGGQQLGLVINRIGVATFIVTFADPVALPPSMSYAGWLYFGVELLTLAGDYLWTIPPFPLVLGVVDRGGGDVCVIFDREVTITLGIDAFFVDTTTADQIVWDGGVGSVQLGSFGAGGSSGNGWQWSPGDGISPDTLVVQSGTFI